LEHPTAPGSGQTASLLITWPDGRHETLALSGQRVRAGRSPDANDLVLAEPSVSGQHLELRPCADGYEIEDLDSTNGTLVNGQRISGPVKLGFGDEIRVGLAGKQQEIRLVYAAQAPAAQEARTEPDLGEGPTQPASPAAQPAPQPAPAPAESEAPEKDRLEQVIDAVDKAREFYEAVNDAEKQELQSSLEQEQARVQKLEQELARARAEQARMEEASRGQAAQPAAEPPRPAERPAPAGPRLLAAAAAVAQIDAAKAARRTLAGGLIKEETLDDQAALIHWPVWRVHLASKRGPLGIQKTEAWLYLDGVYGQLLTVQRRALVFTSFTDQPPHRVPGLEKLAALQRVPLSTLSPAPASAVLDEPAAAARIRQLFGGEVLAVELVAVPIYRFSITHRRSKQARTVYVDALQGRLVEGLGRPSAAPAPAQQAAARQPAPAAQPAAPQAPPAQAPAFDLRRQQHGINRARARLEKIAGQLVKLGIDSGMPVLDVSKGKPKRLYREYESVLRDMLEEIAVQRGSRAYLEQLLAQRRRESDQYDAQSQAAQQRFMGGLRSGGMTASAFDQLNPQYNYEMVQISLRRMLVQQEISILSELIRKAS